MRLSVALMCLCVCAALCPAYSAVCTVDLPTPQMEMRMEEKPAVDKIALTLRFKDVVTSAPVPITKLSLLRTMHEVKADKAGKVAETPRVPKPFEYFSMLRYRPSIKLEKYRNMVMGILNVPLPVETPDTVHLNIDGELAGVQSLWWVRAEAPGYYPVFRPLAMNVLQLANDERVLTMTRTVMMSPLTRRIVADDTTRTIDLCPGVTAVLPPTAQDLTIDVIPEDAVSAPLTTIYNRPLYSLCVAVYPEDVQLSAPMSLRIEADRAFPMMRARTGLTMRRLNWQTMTLDDCVSVSPEMRPRPKGATTSRWDYRTSVTQTGMYLLQR